GRQVRSRPALRRRRGVRPRRSDSRPAGRSDGQDLEAVGRTGSDGGGEYRVPQAGADRCRNRGERVGGGGERGQPVSRRRDSRYARESAGARAGTVRGGGTTRGQCAVEYSGAWVRNRSLALRPAT